MKKKMVNLKECDAYKRLEETSAILMQEKMPPVTKLRISLFLFFLPK